MLPPSTMDDFVEWPPIWTCNDAQRPIGGVSHGQKVGEDPVVGEAQNLPGKVLVFDGGMAGAESQIRGGHRDRHGRLAQVVLEQVRAAGVFGLWGDDRYRRRGASDVPGTAPHACQALKLCPVGHDDEVPRLPVAG